MDRYFLPTERPIAFSYKPKTSPTVDIALLDWKSRQVKKLTNEQTQDHLWQAVDMERRWQIHPGQPRQCGFHRFERLPD